MKHYSVHIHNNSLTFTYIYMRIHYSLHIHIFWVISIPTILHIILKKVPSISPLIDHAYSWLNPVSLLVPRDRTQ